MHLRTVTRLVLKPRAAWILPGILLAGAFLGGSVAAGEPAPVPANPAVTHLFQWRPFLAPFHAVMLHFPIGFFTAAVILEIYRCFRPSDELRRVTMLIIWLSLLSGIVTATFGLMRAATGEYDPQAVKLHRAVGLAVPVFTLATLVFQTLSYRSQTRRIWTYGYRALLAATLSLIVIAGHLGGSLTHGSKYLVENAPKFLRDLLEKDPPPNQTPTGKALDAKQRFYLEKVQPLFAAKCYGCHGPKKQKSGYRLDQPEIAVKGGDSEETAIKPGDPMESHLARLILLAPDDDDVMPPEGKKPLTSEEIMTVLDWIRNGAVFAAADSAPAAP
jgi:uncharacterized membrane protein/mono/diheme cytochrome c family protein